MNKEQQAKKSLYSEMEEQVIDFWHNNNIFKKSVNKDNIKGDYVFYDGPPFITGLPHYATLLPSIAKDVIPRYWTMKGYRVKRVWGWDCHGLPAENKVEKNLELKNKKDIEKLGVKDFVAACRDYVGTSSKQWQWYINRIGRWVDMDNAYRTMDLSFMESVIWAFKELYNKKLIYEGYRTSLHCPRCATPLSKFEVTMDAGSYRDIEDHSIVVKFKTQQDFYLLAWTTTPWTLPGNLALAVGSEISYVFVESLNEKYVLAKDKVQQIFKDKKIKIIKEIKGKDLVGTQYQPIFDLNNQEIKNNESVFKVYSADFVNTQEGTGIVHIAPNFGEDDFNLGQEVNLPIIELMDENGVYTDKTGQWNNYYFKKANKKVLEELKDKLFLQEKTIHSYPFCYRCDTSLIHKTQKAWYLKISDLRQKMINENENINWVPNYFKQGRFEYNLKNAPDWCLSRSRYWGSPIPVWKCNCGNIKVVGSIKEIQELSGKQVKELHRPEIDEITFKCDECSQEMKRVPEILDCWFESGAMPFAQFHYPFQKKQEWTDLFPADFIIEYTGQLRGWFYYLHVLSNALFDSVAFKNVIVTGVLAGDDGRKMSKSLGNYPDPKIVLNKYGSDALRIYFMASPIMVGGDMFFNEQDVQDAMRKNIILLWNVVKFYDIFAQNNKFLANENQFNSENILDKWIISKFNLLVEKLTLNLDEYNIPSACQLITTFINDLSTWYIRRSRNRFKGEDQQDLQAALETTGYILLSFSKIIAPIMPFIAEQIWQKITNNNFEKENESVHLQDWLQHKEINQEVIDNMQNVRKIVEIGLAQRDDKKIKVRQPLKKIKISNCQLTNDYLDLIKDELNVKEIEICENNQEMQVEIDFNITKELKDEGIKREMVRLINNMRKESGLGISDIVNVFYETDSQDIKDIINNQKLKKSLLKDVLAKEIIQGINENSENKKELEIDGNKITFSI